MRLTNSLPFIRYDLLPASPTTKGMYVIAVGKLGQSNVGLNKYHNYPDSIICFTPFLKYSRNHGPVIGFVAY